MMFSTLGAPLSSLEETLIQARIAEVTEFIRATSQSGVPNSDSVTIYEFAERLVSLGWELRSEVQRAWGAANLRRQGRGGAADPAEILKVLGL